MESTWWDHTFFRLPSYPGRNLSGADQADITLAVFFHELDSIPLCGRQ